LALDDHTFPENQRLLLPAVTAHNALFIERRISVKALRDFFHGYRLLFYRQKNTPVKPLRDFFHVSINARLTIEIRHFTSGMQ